MKIKTSELQGAALDWAAAKCEKVEFTYEDHPHHEMFDMHYSTSWAQGGPIIERERIAVEFVRRDEVDSALLVWSANKYGTGYDEEGFTPLIAAMRCYVASKLGDEVEIPEGLK